MTHPRRILHSAYFLLSSWLLLLLVSYRLFICEPIATSSLEGFFFSLTYVGYFFWITTIISLVLSCILLIPTWRFLKTLITTVFFAFTTSLGFAVSTVYSIWRMGINDKLLLFATAPGAGKVVEVSQAAIVSIVLALLILLAISWLAALLIQRLSEKTNHKFLKTALWLGATLLIVSQTWSFISIRQNNTNTAVLTQKLPQYHYLAPASIISQWIPPSKEEHVTLSIQKTLKLMKPIQMPPVTGHTPNNPPDILLIVVDTLRADMLTPEIMPNTFRFAAESDQFLAHDSGGNCTQPGIFSLFYGIPPTYWNSAIEYPKAPPLIERLQQLHYHIDLFASAPLTVPNFDQSLFSTLPHPLPTPGDNAIERDKAITHKTIHVVERHSQHIRHMTFVFLDAVHSYGGLPQLNTPWQPENGPNYLTLSKNLNKTPIVNRYKNAVYFDDKLIGNMLDALKKNHALDHTVVIITADHGQSFNDLHKNYWGHASNFSNYQLRVPMIIRWPNKTPQIIHYRTSHYDIATTLLHRVLGVDADPYAWSVGHDLYAKQPAPWIIAQSYVNTALVSKNKIITLYPSGNHYSTNPELVRVTPGIPKSALDTLLQDSTRFFKRNTHANIH